ncbi:ECF RNA polymerase sigma factor RpoE [termite gut metagenome]|uniref:ECF RNA polymerase sigma factor RpoE n=1 Tax=termite gut metagenome TaxID=433724 RepID=A0A5J4SNX1_9ZZZZ
MNKRNIGQAQVNAIERDILENIKKGDLHSFKQLFENYYVMLCYIANRYLNSKQLSEEIVDDVFYKIWENRETLNIHTSLKAYIVKAVRNRSINYLEQNRLSCYISDAPIEDDRENSFFADTNTPLSDLIGKEQEDAITLAINSLPAGCRKIFHLRHFENLNYEEIAIKQNISINTVKSQMQTALQKLRQLLSPYHPFLFLMLQDVLWNLLKTPSA